MSDYYVYLLINENKHTYIGITNDIVSRIEKHNNKTGAKATKKSNTWKYAILCKNFTKSTAGRFEWYWKHVQNKNNKWIRTPSGLDNKIKRLNQLLEMTEWKDVVKEIKN
jgi:predicted GIY-YIG superfamily endonuclease